MSHHLFELFFNVGKFLSLTPSSTNNQNPSCVQKLYEIFIFLAYASGRIFLIIVSKEEIFANLTSIRLVLGIMSITNQFFFIFYIVIIVMRWKRQCWFKLIQNLDTIQDTTRLKWYYITISTAFTVFISLEIYHIYTLLEEKGLESLKLYFLADFENYVTFFYSLFIVVILGIVLAKYKQQDVTLVQITKAKNLLYSKQIVTILKKTKSNIFILKEIVDTFNDIFGWIILCNIFEAAAKSLIYIDMIIKKNVTQQNSQDFIFENVWLFILWMGILATIFLCDTILKTVEDILSQAYKLEASFDDLATYETDEVQIFIDVVQHNRPEFKAARFFSIDRSTLFSVLNSLTTFLLVMIQFKEN
ncbi:uncharacterized protein LOC123008429 [Tribolium madens]|uniref:uncharacterized protein LOC123008429 n=1 Tax=Tribolium madens TaxID=41895 RepID=UPI001CF741D0|nr:uncharacterized protein LOC123008429 [Tribolium madens]